MSDILRQTVPDVGGKAMVRSPSSRELPTIQHLSSVLETFEDAAALIGRDGAVVAANRAWHVHGFSEPVFADGDPLPVAAIVAGDIDYRSGVGRRQRGDGWRWYRSRIRALGDLGEVVAVLTHRDITDERRLQMRMHHSPVAHLELDASGALANVNERWEELRGRPVGAELGDRWLRDSPEEQRHQLRALLRRGEPFDFDLSTTGADDRSLSITIEFHPVVDGDELIGWHAAATDHTEVRALQSAAQNALMDPVTGLANRSLFTTTVTRKLAGRLERPLALLFADLDGFKAVNDTHGHTVGDEVLRAVAQRLAGVLRPDDLIARYGGDEFAVMLENADVDVALEIGRRLVDAGGPPVTVGTTDIGVGVSVGVAVATHGEALESLLSRADQAMYRAKRSGGNCVAADR